MRDYAGQTTTEQVKIELLSKWKLKADFRNITQEHTTGKHKAGPGSNKTCSPVCGPSLHKPVVQMQHRSNVAVALSNQFKTVRA